MLGVSICLCILKIVGLKKKETTCFVDGFVLFFDIRFLTFVSKEAFIVVTVDAMHGPVEFFFPFACWDCGLLSLWRTTVSKFCFTTYEMDKISCKLVEWNFDPIHVMCGM